MSNLFSAGLYRLRKSKVFWLALIFMAVISVILCVEMGVGVALLDQNTRLSHDSAVRTIPIPGADMYVVAASIRNDYRPVVQNVMKVLQGLTT